MKSKPNINLIRVISNVLIVGSLTSIMYMVYPVAKDQLMYYLNQPASNVSENQEFILNLPSIGVTASVIKNVNPWDQIEYQAKLQQGVAHAQGTALPGESGTTYLFAHSADQPWRITRYNIPFYRLRYIKAGDTITITYQGKRYDYQVSQKKVVTPDQTQYLTQVETDQLILQTCTPIFTDWKRLLVFAKPI